MEPQKLLTFPYGICIHFYMWLHQIISVLLGDCIFIHEEYLFLALFSCDFFVWFWHQGYTCYREWVWKFSYLFWCDFIKHWYWFLFKHMVEFNSKFIWLGLLFKCFLRGNFCLLFSVVSHIFASSQFLQFCIKNWALKWHVVTWNYYFLLTQFCYSLLRLALHFYE